MRSTEHQVFAYQSFGVPVVPPEEPVAPVVPPEVSVVEHPKTMDPVARYRNKRVQRYSVQRACKHKTAISKNASNLRAHHGFARVFAEYLWIPS